MPEQHDNKFVNDGYSVLKASMVEVQKRGVAAQDIVRVGLEKARENFEFRKRVPYLRNIAKADIEVDFIVGNTFIDVTHSEPLIAGHSNENKLHQALAELYLLKIHEPVRPMNLVVGGKRSKWAPYVLKALEIFYDDVAYIDDRNFAEQLIKGIRTGARSKSFWENEWNIFRKIKLITDESRVNISNGRFDFYRDVIRAFEGQTPPQYPNQVENSLLAKMARDGQESTFWEYLRTGRTDRIWQERNYFNPLEAAVELILDRHDLWFKGGLGKGVPVHHSVLHDMGFTKTRFTEDFMLYSERLQMPVYIQCKSAAGGVNIEDLGQGRTSTTKAVPDRAREQVGRSLLYRSRYDVGSTELKSSEKDYAIVHVIDGNWSGPKVYRLKYVHLLQIAGSNSIFTWDDVIKDYEPNFNGPLGTYLAEILGCKKNEIKRPKL